MSRDRVFLDTFFIQALLNHRDRYHLEAKGLFPHIRAAREVWITEAIMVEVGNALSAIDRAGATEFIRLCYRTSNIHVVSIDTPLLNRALTLYDSRPDKTWGLTDCLSFVVMDDQSLTDAATADQHFRQAGFRPLLSESP